MGRARVVESERANAESRKRRQNPIDRVKRVKGGETIRQGSEGPAGHPKGKERMSATRRKRKERMSATQRRQKEWTSVTRREQNERAFGTHRKQNERMSATHRRRKERTSATHRRRKDTRCYPPASS